MKGKGVIVIVDAYSTGRFLPLIFNGYGYECIHIHSHPNLDQKKMNYISNMFIKDIWYDNNLDEVIEQLKPYKIKFVAVGSEYGVLLADLINSTLQLPFSNSLSLSPARKDKFKMQEVIKDFGLASIPQFMSKNYEDIIYWINNNSGYPVVVKPLAAQAAEYVRFCISEKEVKKAFLKITNNKTLCGEENQAVLVQKRLEGNEYVVNTVSSDGYHFITDIWTNCKKIIGGQSVYDYQELISPCTKEFEWLIDYTKKVLTALEIRYGAAHSEIIKTKEEGAVLIETGARLSGGFNPSVTMDALQFSQISVLVDMYFGNKTFINKYSTNFFSSYKLNKKVLIVSLISNKSGIIKKN